MCCITVFCCVQELRNDAELQEGNLGWLKARMAALIEICADSDGQRQGSALSKLSTDFKGLLASLSEVGEAFSVLGARHKSDLTSLLGIDSVLLINADVIKGTYLFNFEVRYKIYYLYFSLLYLSG